MAGHVAVVEIELRLPGARSLKDRRQRLRPILDRLRSGIGVSVAETGDVDKWQVAAITVAVAASSPGSAESVLDEVDRIVWSRPDVEVVESRQQWMELD